MGWPVTKIHVGVARKSGAASIVLKDIDGGRNCKRVGKSHCQQSSQTSGSDQANSIAMLNYFVNHAVEGDNANELKNCWLRYCSDFLSAFLGSYLHCTEDANTVRRCAESITLKLIRWKREVIAWSGLYLFGLPQTYCRTFSDFFQ